MADSEFQPLEAQPPKWWSALQLGALLLMLVPPLFPRMPAPANLGCALAFICVLTNMAYFRIPWLSESIHIKAAFLVFTLALPFFVLRTGWIFDWDPILTKASFHRALDTAKALLSILLLFQLVRQNRSAAQWVFALFLLAAFGITLWAPVEFVLGGDLQMSLDGILRLSGTRGNPHRYAVMIYNLIPPVCLIMVSEPLRKSAYSKALVRTGYGFCLILPFMLLRAPIPEFEQATWLPTLSQPAQKATFIFWAVWVALISAFFWHLATRPGRSRGFCSGLVFALIIFNILLTAVRVQAAFGLFLGLLILLSRSKYVRFLIGLPLLVGLLFAGMVFVHPSAANLSSLRIRQEIWQQTLPVIQQQPWLGYGYGSQVFKRAFHEANPGHTAYHGHNLWLELLVERGIVGSIIFHWLWFTVFCWSLSRWWRHRNDSTAPPLIATVLLLLFLLLDGLLNWSLIKYNEMLFFFVCGLNIALFKFEQISSQALEETGTGKC